MKQNNRIEDIYGPQSNSDDNFTKKARLLQSIYRVQAGESMGIGPNENSKDKKDNPTYYGNMLVNGKESAKNFFFTETFKYALKRVKEKKKDETIGEYRLFNNLLSSMPMAFNLFHPLMMIGEKDPEALNQMIRDAFPELPVYRVDEIKIEYIPTPVSRFTNDKSAMDAAIMFSDKDQNTYIIAIETKYTDSLGLNKASDDIKKQDVAKESGLFSEEGLKQIKQGCTQIYRNFLLTEKYRMVHHLQDSYSIILAPEEHPTTASEIVSLQKYLKQEYRYKLQKYSLENFISALKKSCPAEFQDWLKQFYDRYLNFAKADLIMNEMRPA